MKKMALHWQVIIALILGLLFSFLAVTFGWNEFTLNYIDPFGEIFINLLKLIAVPLVLFSIISGIVNLKDIRQLGKMGIKTLLIYVVTTMFAVSVGLFLVNAFKPGTKAGELTKTEKRIEYELWMRSAEVKVLDNICLVCDEKNAELVAKVQSRLAGNSSEEWVEDKIATAKNTKSQGPLQPLVDVVPNNIITALAQMHMLQVIFFAIFFGIVMVLIPSEKSEPMAKFVDSANEIFTKMVNVVMMSMPIFVFALMAGALVKAAGNNVDKLKELLSFLTNYSLVVVLGLAFMAFVFYPTLIALFGGNITPRKFLSGINKAQLTAFSTSSSVATLPVTMDCVHNNLGVSKSTTSFVLPIGATVNMDGTSLYQAVAVVALAQLHGVDLSFDQQLVIVLTATLASIGAAAVPSAGLVLMIVVLESVGLNPAWIALIFPVDRILDMCRTVVNVTGDATVSVLVNPKT
jgi:Na+/H+-dicarboxylate symporter